jgi:hypothetical protein
VLAELGEFAVDERARGGGENDLAPVARGGDPGGTVELTTCVALARQTNLSRVQPHPHLDLARGEGLLSERRCRQRPDGIGEGEQRGVPLGIDLDTTMG